MASTYSYVRCSHQESALSGISIPGQIAQNTRYAADYGLPAFGTARYPASAPQGFYVDEAVSAWVKSPLCKRPAGKELVRALQPGDHVVLWSIDRGFRSVKDFAITVQDWIDRDISVHMATQDFRLTTANGRMMANFFAVYAQWKSDILSERLKEAAAIRKAAKDNHGPKAVERWSVSPEAAASSVPLSINPSIPSGRVFTYSRASHLDSVKSGLGLDAQAASTEACAVRLIARHASLTRAGHFQDNAVSAYKTPFRKRASGGALFRELRSGDHVVVARLDRAWRSVRDMLDTVDEWTSNGITVHFADMGISSASLDGKIMLQIMAVMAAWESHFISVRTRLAMAECKRLGRAVNGIVKAGFSVIHYTNRATGQKFKRFVLCPKKVADIWYIQHLHNNHRASYDIISDIMENIYARKENRKPIPRSGIYTRKRVPLNSSAKHLKTRLLGRKWSKSAVRKACLAWPNILEILNNREKKRHGQKHAQETG
jgi:DNA invertase Pin-like site-specific DNA recombinase